MKQLRLFSVASLALFMAACAGPLTDPAVLMDYDALAEGLREAGAQVEPAGEIEQAFFSVGGMLIRVSGQDVQVFEYTDVASRQADSDQISADGSSIGTTMVTWVDQPNFWAQGLLIVLYVGKDPGTMDLLNGVLGQPLTKS